MMQEKIIEIPTADGRMETDAERQLANWDDVGDRYGSLHPKNQRTINKLRSHRDKRFNGKSLYKCIANLTSGGERA